MTSVRCRAKNPAVCADPNCPERRAAREAFVAAAAAERARERQADIRGMLRQDVDLGDLSPSGEDYVDRLRSNLAKLTRARVTSATRGEAWRLVVDHERQVGRMRGLSEVGREHVDQLVGMIRLSLG